MALSGTTNLDSLTLSGNFTVAGTITNTGPVTNNVGAFQPVSRFVGAGTVTNGSGIVNFDASVAGFAVRLPAPVLGAEFTIVNHTAPASGVNTITIPSGGTIYQQAATGTVLSLGTAGQAVRLVGLNSTQYQVVSNLGTVTLS